MPVLDMPIEKLRTYQGRTPRPADFDAFWQKAKAELQAIDPDFKMVPADFHPPFAEAFDLYFTGTRGARIHGRMLRPKNLQHQTPLEIRFHGLGGHAGEWPTYLGMAASGFTVLGMDCRGQRGMSEDTGTRLGSTQGNSFFTRGLLQGPEHLYYRDVYLDCCRLAELAMALPWVDASKTAVTGGSQGGGLALVCAGLVPGLNRIVPVYPFLCDYRRVWEMDLALNAYHDIRDFLRAYDPTHRREEEFFTTLGYIDAQFFAESITAQVQMHTGLLDNICPPSTQFAAYNKISAPKEVILYPDFGHETLPTYSETAYKFLLDMI